MTQDTVIVSDGGLAKVLEPVTGERGSIRYPMTVNYAPSWGMWEVLREMVYQEAMDNYRTWMIGRTRVDGKVWTRAEMSEPRNGLLQPRHFLFGVGDKDEDARGRFREGIKLAMLALLRQEIPFYIRSGGTKYWAEFDSMLGEEVMALHWEPAFYDKNLMPATEVMFQYSGLMYRERVVSAFSDDKVLFTAPDGGQIIKKAKDEPGLLYVKGLYVCDLSRIAAGKAAAFSYNIPDAKVDRDRGMVENYDVLTRIGQLWLQVDDQQLWKAFFKAVLADGQENISFERGIDLYGTLVAMDVARKAWADVTGKKPAVYYTSNAHSAVAERIGSRVVYLPVNLNSLREIIPSDRETVEEHDRAERHQPDLILADPDIFVHLEFLVRRMVADTSWDVLVFEMLVPEVRVLRQSKTVEVPSEWITADNQTTLYTNLILAICQALYWGTWRDDIVKIVVRALVLGGDTKPEPAEKPAPVVGNDPVIAPLTIVASGESADDEEEA